MKPPNKLMQTKKRIEERFLWRCKIIDGQIPSQHGYYISEICSIAWVLGIEDYFKQLLLNRKPYARGEKRNDYLEAAKTAIAFSERQTR